MLHILNKTETEIVDVSYVVTYDEVGSEITIYHKRGLNPAQGVTLPLDALPELVAVLTQHIAAHGGEPEAEFVEFTYRATHKSVEDGSTAMEVPDAETKTITLMNENGDEWQDSRAQWERI